VADGFSCKEQIRQQTNREGMHLAQVIQAALQAGGKSQSSGRLKPFVLPKMRGSGGSQGAGNGEEHRRRGGASRFRRLLGTVAGGATLAATSFVAGLLRGVGRKGSVEPVWGRKDKNGNHTHQR